MGKKFGCGWSWKRAFGLQALRQALARVLGTPTTKLGFERKIGRTIMRMFFKKW